MMPGTPSHPPRASRLFWSTLLLSACSSVGHPVAVQERSPVISRETAKPVLQHGAPAPDVAGNRRAAPTVSARSSVGTPVTGVNAGLTPPQPVGRSDEPVAVSSPLSSVPSLALAAPGSTASAPPAAVEPRPAAASAGMAGIEWTWPVDSPVNGSFSEASKGISFQGHPGQAIRAAASGTVSYVGTSLRGYGHMLVIKHDKAYLTVYAHNSQILVKEGEKVTRGQKVAEMGSSESSAVELHFELRHQGKPIDPIKLLPVR